MKSFLLQQVRLLAPGSKFHKKKVDILIESGKIKEIGKSIQLKNSRGVEHLAEKGAYVSPGWFDMQVHLSDPGFEYKETFDELNKAAIRGGFTGLLCYPNTYPVVDNSQILRSLIQQTEDFAVDFHFTGALSHGVHGKDLAEVFEMHHAGALAFTDGSHPVQDSGLLLRAMQYTRSFSGLIIDCPMDMSLNGSGQMHEGPISTQLGMKGIPTLSETIALSRQLQLLDYSPSRFHVQPLSTPEAANILGSAKRKHKGLSVGTAIQYLCMSDEELLSFDPNYKLFPPLRSKKDVKALQKALKKGIIDVLTSAHQAQGMEEKNLQFEQAEPGMLSLQSFFSLANEHLIQSELIDLEKWVELVSLKPRQILNIPFPQVEEGEEANLTIFHPKKEWEFNKSHIPSRAKNSPLIGRKMKGQVLGVLKGSSYFSLS
ncbi:MAG: dihydroorotase [Bacteroidota bacterium]